MQALNDWDQFVPEKADEKWFSVLGTLPGNLRAALLLELELGNEVRSIECANWPQTGSIFICLKSSFKNKWADNPLGVEYRLINDPHYWYDEISQTAGGVQHLIVT